MNIKDLKYNAEEQKEFIKKGGLLEAAKREKEIMQKVFTKEELEEKKTKK